MLSLASKTFLAIAVFAVGGAIFYTGVVQDRSGAVLFVALSIGSIAALLATTRTDVRDASQPASDEPAAAIAVDRSAAGYPAPWPVLAAGSVVAVAVGLINGPDVLIPGLVVAVAMAGGWYGRNVREHGTWTPVVRERVASRLVRPLGMPVGALLLLGVIAVSISRVLLAINKDAATFLAIALAVVAMGGCAFLASRPSLGTNVLWALAGVAGVAVIAAGFVGGAQGEREFHHEHDEGAITVSALDSVFEAEELELPAGETVEVTLINRDELPHNFAVYSEDGEPLVSNPPFSGVGRQTYHFETPDKAGEYSYVCEIHPATMTGKLVLE